MLSITLLPQDEYCWLGENPSPATFPPEKGIYPLYHQWRTYNAEEPIVVNINNTGTGKTKAALLRLLKRARTKGFTRLFSSRDNVLLIAPTNELLSQHVADACHFCQENDLPYRVLPLTKAVLEACKEIPNFSEEELRRSARLHYILNDGSKIDDDTGKRATIYVTNPDIFYYAIYFCYNRFDRGPLFNDFIQLFNYVIIDEFHYYDPKQLAAFLFFIKLSQKRRHIDSNSKRRQFCILTATPRPQVKHYLDNLGLQIAWIEPGEQQILPEDRPYVKPVRALTPVELYVYSTEELQESKLAERSAGLFRLVSKEKERIRAWLDTEKDGYKMEGAIISSSLGTISNIHQALLSSIPKEKMGRITGAEVSASRNEAKDQPLILATPTVDIGYNFDRAQKKLRQNIDFLCCDAYAGDELIQRIGRAGRVLAKEQKDHPSIVMAVIDTDSYQLLKDYDGKCLERPELAQLALEMSKKNDLYAYVKTGAILEAFRPIKMIKQGMSSQEASEFDAFFADLHRFFADKDDTKRAPCTFGIAYSMVNKLDKWQAFYGLLRTIPQEAFDKLPLLLEKRIPWEPKTFQDPYTESCLEAFYKRLKDQGKAAGNTAEGMLAWIQNDLKDFYKERARFSFRESFQPPLALVYDPGNLHSAREIAIYNALHFLKYYHASFFETFEAWREQTGQLANDVDATGATAYCHLHQLREAPLQVGLRLDAVQHLREGWESAFAYQMTALHGLEVVILNEHSGLKRSVQTLFSKQFIPAFVVLNDSSSHTNRVIHQLRKQARFYPLPLEVTFGDGRTLSYAVILGTMAFQVCAEIPYWAKVKDLRKTMMEDDAPIIC